METDKTEVLKKLDATFNSIHDLYENVANLKDSLGQTSCPRLKDCLAHCKASLSDAQRELVWSKTQVEIELGK